MNKPGLRLPYRSAMGMIVLASLMAGCDQPTTFVPGLTDSFVADTGITLNSAAAVYQADYVFVLDYSWSMRNKRDALVNKMGNFISALQSENIDYRIGFAYGTANGLGRYGSLQAKLDGMAHKFVAPFLDSSASASLEDSILSQVSSVGEANSPNTPVFLESAVQTLAGESSFIRPASQLVLVFVSDRDDASHTELNANRTVSYYVTALKALKSNAAYINARAFVAGGSGCPLQNGDADGTRLAQVAQQVDALHTNTRGCVYDDEASTLESLARNVTKPTDRFTLGSRPLTSTISVRVNGVTSTAWSYASATNEIVFSTPPDPSASIDIRYQIAFVLSRTPKVASIKVTVDGNAVSQSNSNGWSYVAAENRIQFNGSVGPSDGSKVLVTYEVQ